jgi:hypothetical protein
MARSGNVTLHSTLGRGMLAGITSSRWSRVLHAYCWMHSPDLHMQGAAKRTQHCSVLVALLTYYFRGLFTAPKRGELRKHREDTVLYFCVL